MIEDNFFKFQSPLLNGGKECPRCGATFQRQTFKCKYCGKVLINQDY
jgi:tRNA(Ile2) C34 agmatinyltransferase TiaS